MLQPPSAAVGRHEAAEGEDKGGLTLGTGEKGEGGGSSIRRRRDAGRAHQHRRYCCYQSRSQRGGTGRMLLRELNAHTRAARGAQDARGVEGGESDSTPLSASFAHHHHVRLESQPTHFCPNGQSASRRTAGTRKGHTHTHTTHTQMRDSGKGDLERDRTKKGERSHAFSVLHPQPQRPLPPSHTRTHTHTHIAVPACFAGQPLTLSSSCRGGGGRTGDRPAPQSERGRARCDPPARSATAAAHCGSGLPSLPATEPQRVLQGEEARKGRRRGGAGKMEERGKREGKGKGN